MEVAKEGAPAVEGAKEGAPALEVAKEGAPAVEVAKEGRGVTEAQLEATAEAISIEPADAASHISLVLTVQGIVDKSMSKMNVILTATKTVAAQETLSQTASPTSVMAR